MLTFLVTKGGRPNFMIGRFTQIKCDADGTSLMTSRWTARKVFRMWASIF